MCRIKEASADVSVDGADARRLVARGMVCSYFLEWGNVGFSQAWLPTEGRQQGEAGRAKQHAHRPMNRARRPDVDLCHTRSNNGSRNTKMLSLMITEID